jgi:hypothetical protein
MEEKDEALPQEDKDSRDKTNAPRGGRSLDAVGVGLMQLDGGKNPDRGGKTLRDG